MFNIGPLELMVVLLIALVVVGPKRLPEIGRTIGKALHELRKVQTEVRDTIRFDFDTDQDEPPTSAASWTPPDEDDPDEGFEVSDEAEHDVPDAFGDDAPDESEHDPPDAGNDAGVSESDAPSEPRHDALDVAARENGHVAGGPTENPSETAGGLE